MNSETANAITDYKTQERLARKLLFNSLIIRIKAEEAWGGLLKMAEADATVGELYANQLATAPGLEDALNAVETNLLEDWALLLQIEALVPAMFDKSVPELPETPPA